MCENKREYELEKSTTNYFRVKELLTGSVGRLQTNDSLLRETFWNYWGHRPKKKAMKGESEGDMK